jgi:SAM-dependent methyltransferase
MNTIIDLGMHPFADTFIKDEQYHLSEPVYPLQCSLDEQTGEIKLKHETRDEERYSLYSYSYTSSNSKFSREHWDNYSLNINKHLAGDSKILEIGSNDGYLTKNLVSLGHKARGVDPSKEMSLLAAKRGIQTYNKLFNLDNSEDIKSDYGPVDAVIANNVLNHANDPDDFVEAVSNVLKDGGLFIYELPYWLCTIKDRKFDQIYHEHVTYFTVKYSYNLMKRHGLKINSVDVVDYHGGSLRVICEKNPTGDFSPSKDVQNRIKEEEKLGLFNKETYDSFMSSLLEQKNCFMEKIYKIKKEGFPIIGVGAAAKANTFLNFYNIDNSVLEYVTDASEYKKGKYTPLTRIPIVGDEIFSNYEKVYALVLSWNISSILTKKIKEINNNVEFLFPQEN